MESQKNDRIETQYVYWVCDKLGCNRKNQRKINIFIRDGEPSPYDIYNDDCCDKCNERIHEPLFIRYNPFRVLNDR